MLFHLVFRKKTKSIFIERSDGHADGRVSVGSTTQIPLHKFSIRYVVKSIDRVGYYKSQFTLASIEDNTNISLTFKMKRNLPSMINRINFSQRRYSLLHF